MKEGHVIVFAEGSPFVPFQIFLSGGRQIDVTHPEVIMLTMYATSAWLFHPTGQAEVVDMAMVTSLKTIGPVDPTTFLPKEDNDAPQT